MSVSAYDNLSSVYDSLLCELDSRAIADHIAALVDRFGPEIGEGESGAQIVCDLGCGTGAITLQLSEHGYEMIGVDQSTQMLALAQALFDRKGKDALFVCQDIAHLDLFGCADVFVALTDTLNHITTPADLRRLFKKLNHFLSPGGLFIFDLLTRDYLEKVRGNHSFQDITDAYALFWSNRFYKKQALSRADITLFTQIEEGHYLRSDFSIKERHYPIEFIREALPLADMELIDVLSNFTNAAPRKTDVRHLYVCRKRSEKRTGG